MRKWLLGAFLLSASLFGIQNAVGQNTISGTLSVVIQAQGLGIVFTPPNPSIACNSPAGTVVSAMSTVGGDGTTVTYGLTSQTDTHSDLTVSGNNIVVGANGINVADCGAAGSTKTWVVTSTASQP